MTTVISLYGKPFTIGFSSNDDARRGAYFKSGTGNLTPQEKSLLLSLGIDTILENSLKPYLAEFFSTLQTCSSDSSLVLSKDCETAYFVIWSAMFHNRAETARRLAEAKGEVISDIDLATDASLISGMKPKRAPTVEELEDSISRLFTLMVVDTARNAPEDDDGVDDITSLFTLMIVGDADDDISVAETEGSEYRSVAESA
jgi:hypothetical protein